MAFPTEQALPPEYGGVGAFLKRWLTTTNHREIGILYIVTSFSFFTLAGVMALLMRTSLAYPGQAILDNGTYNRLFSTHGTLMIFLFIIPVLTGFSNYFVPLLIGAKDMAYPRINALGYWMIPPAGTLVLIGNAPVGWTGYTPLSIQEGASVNFWLVGLIIIGTSSIVGAVNFLVTIFKLRAPGVSFRNLSLFVWSVLTTQFMVLMATPVLAAALTMVLADRLLHTCFFNTLAACTVPGGDPLGDSVLYQHLFWFYSHPAVYIMILPSMGMISEVIPVMSRKPIFGYKAIAYSTVAIGLMGFTVWVHHMFTTGIDIWVRFPFMIATVAIAVPSGVKVFNWLATMWGGKILLDTPMLFAIGFLSMFVIGGISGVFQASIPVDYQLQDTYFVVAHLHYVLFGGSVLGLFAGTYFWYPMMTGRRYDERLGRVHFWLTLVGLNLVFFTMHFLGLMGMPRRYADYTVLLPFQPLLLPLNQLATVGAFVLAFGQLPFFYNMIKSRWVGPVVTEDPWADRGPAPWRSPLEEEPAPEAPPAEVSPGGGNGGR
jgi:cytochrome c oxidase subunit I